MKDTLRAGAMAVGVATGLLALATTAQTPDGYIHASFGGPLDVFKSSSAEVLAIGDGNNDASELAALLKGPVGPAAREGAFNSPYGVAYEAGAAPNATTGAVPGPPPATLFPVVEGPATEAPTSKNAAILPSKPVVDSQGRIDCSGAVSCHTDPVTNITTVTYPDGIVAIVQKVNDLTVVAYKTLTEMLPSEIASLLPPVPTAPTAPAAAPPMMASVAPTTAAEAAPTATAPTPEATVAATAPEPTSASIDPGPPAPDIDLGQPDRGPRINVTTPPKDFSPGPGTGLQPPKIPGLGKVKDTIGGVVDAVKDAVGKALGPGASSKPASPGGSPTGSQTSSGSQNSSQDSKPDKAGDGS